MSLAIKMEFTLVHCSKIVQQIKLKITTALYVHVTVHRNKFLYNKTNYEGWDFNSGNYLFTTDTK